MDDGGQAKPKRRWLAVVCLVVVLLLFTAAGALGGLYFVAGQDPELAGQLSGLPVVGGLFAGAVEPVVSPEDELEQQRTVLELTERELELRRMEIERVEREVRAKTVELQAQRTALIQEEEALAALRSELEGRRADLDRLVVMYEQMKPQAVAEILPRLSDAMAIAILGRLDDSRAAKIMEQLDRDVAVRYTQQMGHQN